MSSDPSVEPRVSGPGSVRRTDLELFTAITTTNGTTPSVLRFPPFTTGCGSRAGYPTRIPGTKLRPDTGETRHT